MPRLRRCGGTKVPAATSTTVRSPIEMRPPSGFSRPATQRSVVVLPQPEGPSSVTISPAPTSKSIAATAVTTSRLAVKVFVSPSTRIIAVSSIFSILCSVLFLHAEAAAYHIGDCAQSHQHHEHDHPEGAEQEE